MLLRSALRQLFASRTVGAYCLHNPQPVFIPPCRTGMSAAAPSSTPLTALSRADSEHATSRDSPSPSSPRAAASGSIAAISTPFTWKQTAEEQAAASTAGRLMVVTYNVNSIRTLSRRLQLSSFSSLLSHLNADILCLQETKVSTLADLPAELIAPDGYDSYWSFDTVNKGRNGVVTYAREGLTVSAREGVGLDHEAGEEALEQEEEVKAVVGDDWTAEEGRCVTTDHGEFVLFNIYFPNAGRGEERLAYKLRYYAALQRRCEQLTRRGRSVIVVGDVNTAHREIDIHNPKIRQTGFLPVERAWMDGVLSPPASSSSVSSSAAAAPPLLVDTWRSFHPGVMQFSFWDQRTLARERNRGWRIDYILASPQLLPLCLHAAMHPEVKGSDHSPVVAYYKPELTQKLREAASKAGQVTVEAGSSRGMIGREWRPVEKVKVKAKGKAEAGKGQKSISSFFAANTAAASQHTAAASPAKSVKRKRKASQDVVTIST